MTKKKMNWMKKMVLTGAAVMVMSFAAPAMAAGVGGDHEDSPINTGKNTSIN